LAASATLNLLCWQFGFWCVWAGLRFLGQYRSTLCFRRSFHRDCFWKSDVLDFGLPSQLCKFGANNQAAQSCSQSVLHFYINILSDEQVLKWDLVHKLVWRVQATLGNYRTTLTVFQVFKSKLFMSHTTQTYSTRLLL